MSERVQDWPMKLHEAVEAARTKPFAWGSNDCCLFAANVVLALTGVDFAAAERGQYDDAAGAAAILEAAGGLKQLLMERLGTPLDTPLLAQRGDVCLYEPKDGRQSAMICCGAFMAGPGEHGLMFVPIDQATLACRV